MVQNMIWKRKCPKCNKELLYATKKTMYRAIKKNSLCVSCGHLGQLSWNKNKTMSLYTRQKMSRSMKGRTPWNKGKKGCFTDETRLLMSINNGMKQSDVRKRVGNSIKENAKNNPNFGMRNKKFSPNSILKLKLSHIGQVPWNKGKTNVYSRERLKNMRLYKIKWVEENKNNGNQIFPTYNPSACLLIEEYGKENGYNFQHAMNGGEFYLKELGYWADGYDKDKNVWIEVDEKHHFDIYGNLKQKDIERQKEIEQFLKCKFIRIRIK